jgi:hypothetical protein
MFGDQPESVIYWIHFTAGILPEQFCFGKLTRPFHFKTLPSLNRKIPNQSTRLLLDGQQRLTSLSSVIRGEPVTVRGRLRPIELLFNLEHTDELTFVTEVNEDNDDDEIEEDESDSTDDELQRRFDRMTFLVATNKLERLPHWVKVSEVFRLNESRDQR